MGTLSVCALRRRSKQAGKERLHSLMFGCGCAAKRHRCYYLWRRLQEKHRIDATFHENPHGTFHEARTGALQMFLESLI
jgi:hypothetical protein